MAEFAPVKSDFHADSRASDQREPVADPHLPVAETAHALRISPATLRRYVKDYSGHVDFRRDGRKLLIAVSSIPTLAQIRDLRAQKYDRDDIQRILEAPPDRYGPASLAGSAVEDAVNAALGDLRAEMESIKQASMDSEIVIRQSLGNILFLIEKFGKELQFHVSEERIANNERDLRMAEPAPEPKQLPKPAKGKKRFLSRFRRRRA